ncbi:MAG TPA: hypothetical protein DCG69_05700 [Bacteroidales bacterium]|nr:hypothetical protein [Bacteroidales bacterium]
MKIGKTNVLVLLVLVLSSCNSTKHIPKNEYLLTKNTIVYKNNSLRSAPLEDYITQTPMPKSLGFFYTNIGIYEALKEKESGLNKWLLRVFGKEPILLNKFSAQESARKMKSFLNNLSYFNAEIEINYKIKKNKATVEYVVDTKQPYKINAFSWVSPDSAILAKIEKISTESLIKTDDLYNAYLLDSERDRISANLRSNGYFRFNRNFITYTIDSAFSNHTLSILGEISLPSSPQSNKAKQTHKQYSIRNIYVYPDFEPLLVFDYDPDTLEVSIPSDKLDNSVDKYHFIYYNKLKIRPKVIGESIFLSNNDLFNSVELDRSFQKLNRFPIFKYVNFSFTEDSVATKSGTLPLDVSIRLSRTKTQSYTIETDLTNTSGDLGVRGNLIYTNRNFFRGSEMLSLRLSTALESRTYSNYEDSRDNVLFNTMEYGLYLGLQTPNFLSPAKKVRFPKYLAPRSIFQLSYNFQVRPSYKRHLGNAAFGYEWNFGQFGLQRLFPIDLSVIKIFPSPEFQANLDTLTNTRYKDQYTDHFIAALKYNLTYNTQRSNKWVDFTYMLFRFEVAGNLASLVNDLSGYKPNAEGYYTLFGIRYAQYVRGEFDYRRFYALSNKQGIIYRAILGLGVPYGNSSALPFEKGFYGGGANGMRGWAYRTLGPGGYSETNLNEFDKMGDIKLEASFEYRFPIIWYLNGALFADVGNVWLLKQNELFPDGHFKWDTFAKQLGIDTGLGFRFDFDFFIVRLDAALIVRDPAKIAGERFVLGQTKFSNIFWNFGIGYPF